MGSEMCIRDRIPGAGVMNETGESLGRNPFKVPKAPVFDGT